MELSIISFTENGMQLSKRIAAELTGVETELYTKLYTKCTAALEEKKEQSLMFTEEFVEERIGEWTRKQMEEKKALLFIGACGIAVRAIAPCLTDKLHDSPVLVMDEKGVYVIPILSGHMGGANEIAQLIAKRTGTVPVITTATDINRKFAVDMFAKRNRLYITNKEGIAQVSSKVLAGKKVTISIEPGHICKDSPLPEELQLIPYPPEQPVDIVVASEEKEWQASILLKPREYVVGMGCRKGKEAEKIEALIRRSLEETGISSTQLLALASIVQKREEPGFLAWSRKANVPFITYTAEQLQEVEGEFHVSSFVKDKVGVDNVCERAALKVCGANARLVYEKHAEDGMTIAVAKREWSVKFDEE